MKERVIEFINSKKINIAYMEIINGYHEDGKNGGEWESIIELARRCSKGECKESLNDPQIINFLEVADYWCQLAFKRGREFAGLEAE